VGVCLLFEFLINSIVSCVVFYFHVIQVPSVPLYSFLCNSVPLYSVPILLDPDV